MSQPPKTRMPQAPFWLKAAVSLAGIAWAAGILRRIDWDLCRKAFSEISPIFFTGSLLCAFLIYALRLCRLRAWMEESAPSACRSPYGLIST